MMIFLYQVSDLNGKKNLKAINNNQLIAVQKRNRIMLKRANKRK